MAPVSVALVRLAEKRLALVRLALVSVALVSVAEESVALVRFWFEKLQLGQVGASEADALQVLGDVAGGAIELRGREVRATKVGPSHGGPRQRGVGQRAGRKCPH